MENKIRLDSIANKKTSFTSYRLIILSLIVILAVFFNVRSSCLSCF
ncbi:MAG: hypothetical protein ACI9JO_000233 [Psychrobacter okhotskensis]|jgi:hypothetical protein